jgi:hypothetical protein
MDGIKIYASYFAVFRGYYRCISTSIRGYLKGGGYNLKSILPF